MQNIIKKCIDELSKENPRQDYVIGMLETLYDLNNEDKTPPVARLAIPAGEYIPTPTVTENIAGISPRKPILNPIVSPELIAKLRGNATVETFNVLNAPIEAQKE